MGRTGAAVSLPARRATPQAIRTAVRQVHGSAPAREAAVAAASMFARYDAAERFRRLIEQELGAAPVSRG